MSSKMEMVQTTQCDVCGGKQYVSTFRWVTVTRGDLRLDLCPNCYKLFSDVEQQLRTTRNILVSRLCSESCSEADVDRILCIPEFGTVVVSTGMPPPKSEVVVTP